MSYIGRGIDQIDNISTLDNLSFNGSDATFNLTQNSVAFVPVSADALQIQIDGVIQANNFTISGSTVTFDFTPDSGSVCNSVKHFGVGLLTQPSDGSVNMAQLGASGTKDATTFLRGDNTFASAGADLDPSSGEVVVNESSADVDFRVESNGNANMLHVDGGNDGVAIGTTGGTHTLQVYDQTAFVSGDSNVANTAPLNVRSSATSGNVGAISIGGNDNVAIYNHGANTLALQSMNAMLFRVSNTNDDKIGTKTERMRIDNSGNVIIGGTSPNLSGADRKFAVQGGDEYTAGFRGQNSGKEVVVIHNQTTGSSDRYMIEFKTGGGGGSGVGSIRSNSSSTAFNTSSDYRLKENEVAISDGITRLKQLKPYKFNFKADVDTTVDGFFAHEVSSIVPEAISGEKDAVKEDGTIIPQQIDQAKLVPLLTSALQEAITKIETLEARVQALENA